MSSDFEPGEGYLCVFSRTTNRARHASAMARDCVAWKLDVDLPTIIA
jgi:hypothetical protein